MKTDLKMNRERASKVLLLICLSLIGKANPKVLPGPILDMLAQVHDSETFGKVFDVRLDSPPQNNTDSDSGRARGNDAGVVTMLENEGCRPRPIVVEVLQPQEKTSFRYPFFITLFRCMGSCGSNPLLAKCTASDILQSFTDQCTGKIFTTKTVIEPLKLRAAEISWENSYNTVDLNRKMTLVSVHNETSCQCACSNKVAACDRFLVWREENCRCECIRYCPDGYVTDENRCCKCVKKQKCGRKQLWNPEKCTCECRKKTCRNPRKLRDPKTCRCECKNIQCRYFGSYLDHKTCTCSRRAKKVKAENDNS